MRINSKNTEPTAWLQTIEFVYKDEIYTLERSIDDYAVETEYFKNEKPCDCPFIEDDRFDEYEEMINEAIY